MHTLYHHPLCPLSRQVRIFLKELGIEFNLIREDYWHSRQEFLLINPASTTPVLVLDSNEHALLGNYSIIEYMHETYENFYFMPSSSTKRAEVRKYVSWFNDKFYREVSKILLDEKMIHLLMRIGEPRTAFIRAAKTNLIQHFKFLNQALENNSYIASEKITCADIAAAAHISVIDYFGEINWDSWTLIKQWYSVIKSRPSFQPLLQDRIPGFNPPRDYSNLDF